MPDAPSLMTWFTHAFHHGGLSDPEWERALSGYAKHRERLLAADPDLGELAAVNLHDGLVQDWELHDVRFTWRLLVGDLQAGYRFATVEYRSPVMLTGGLPAADVLEATRGKELVSDELDLGSDRRFEHRFFFWPDVELGVAFDAVSVGLAPATPADRILG